MAWIADSGMICMPFPSISCHQKPPCCISQASPPVSTCCIRSILHQWYKGLNCQQRPKEPLPMDVAVLVCCMIPLIGCSPPGSDQPVGVCLRNDPPSAGPSAPAGASMLSSYAATFFAISAGLARVGDVVPVLRRRAVRAHRVINPAQPNHLRLACGMWSNISLPFRWLKCWEGPKFESSRQNLPEMRAFWKRYFSDTANTSAPMIR